MHFDFHSLRMKFILIGAGLLLIAMGLLGGIGYYYANHYLDVSENEAMRLITEKYQERIDHRISRITLHLESVADTARIREGKTREDVMQALKDGMRRMPELDLISYIDLQGVATRPNGASAQLGDREYFKRVVETKQNCVSEVLVSKATGKLSVIIAVPVIHQGQMRGMVIGTYSLENMQEIIKAVKLKENGYGYLIDEKGTVLLDGKHPELAGKINLLGAPTPSGEATEFFGEDAQAVYKAAAQSEKQEFGAYKIDNVMYYGAFNQMKMPGGKSWMFAIAAPETEVVALATSLRRVMLGMTAICIVLAIAAIAAGSGRFTAPIVRIERRLGQLAAGDLRLEKLPVSGRDEIARLSASCNKMADNLRSLIATIQRTTEQVAASSEELTANADQSAQVTSQVAQTIADVALASSGQLEAIGSSSAVVKDMSGTVRNMANKMQQSAEQAVVASGAAHEGNASVESAVEQMHHIEATVNHSAAVVGELGARSQEIGQIVEAISGIAGQTNLLALNAAIEAARAGEQGKGFAVVAEEVRKLAEQSQEAARRIAALITTIRKDTEAAVVAMDEGTAAVRSGSEVVAKAGRAFGEIVASVEVMSDGISEMSRHAQEISAGTENIVCSMQGIDEKSRGITAETQSVSAATEEQAAAMEEIASASRSLADLAQELQEASSKFRV